LEPLTIAQDIKPTKIFGQPIDDVIEKEKSAGISRDGIPTVVTRCINYLIPKHTSEEGLFRVSGASTEVQAMKEAFDKGETVDIEGEVNPHNVTGLLKQFVRELPSPLIPQDKQTAFIVIAGMYFYCYLTTFRSNLLCRAGNKGDAA